MGNIRLLLALVIAGAVITAYFSIRFGFNPDNGFDNGFNVEQNKDVYRNVTFTKVCIISWN